MKNLINLLTLILSITLFSSCWDIFGGLSGNKEYYIFTYQPMDTKEFGDKNGFFKITVSDGTFEAKRLNDFYPVYGWGDYYLYYNEKGTCAFICDHNLTPSNATSNLAYFTADDPNNVVFVPLPAKKKDWTWTIPDQKPVVLSDGKIIVIMKIYTDYPYDDASDSYVAIFNPSSNSWEIGTSPLSFVLAQPEKGNDTEAAGLETKFAVSLDENKVYVSTYGYGVDGGSLHVDAHHMAAYNIINKNYERLFYGSNIIYGVTNQNVYFYNVPLGKTSAIDINSKILYKNLDDYPDDYYTFAKTKEQLVKSWRGSGLGAITKNGTTYNWMHIINTSKLTSNKYAGLGGRARYTKDEDALLYAGSTDFYTNYASEFAIFKTPLISENPDPEQLFVLPKNFSTHFYYSK